MNSLPRLSELEIEGFSLYEGAEQIVLTFETPATCLAGANGIGKSTFLAIVNFAFTGIVPDTRKSFVSLAEYASNGRRFALEYFDGRIEERDRETAVVRIAFTVGALTFRVSRHFFTEGLLSLQIGSEEWEGISQDRQIELQHIYEERLSRACGLANFHQVSFLLTYVLTFDERRQLLFWDEQNLTLALHLFFNISPEASARFAELTEIISAAESRARNYRWQAKRLQDRYKEAYGGPGPSTLHIDLKDKYDLLTQRADELEEQVQQKRSDVSSCQVAIADLSRQLMTLRSRYEAQFAAFLSSGGSFQLKQVPVIRKSLDSNECPVCGTKGFASEVFALIESHLCPVCRHPLSDPDLSDSSSRDDLDMLDVSIAKTRQSLDDQTDRLTRLETDLNNTQQQLDMCLAELVALEKEEPSLRANTNASHLLGEIEHLNRQADEERILRNRMVREAEDLREDLETKYRQAEDQFVPRFQELSRLFIGLDIDLHLEPRTVKNTPLLRFGLELHSSRRQRAFQLSESQRFFIDIALRMSLLSFLNSNDNHGGIILVDTPEGSLDIAYENNAGSMFARFVETSGVQLIMTTNINSSGLIRHMARESGRASMKLVPMTDWVILSEVQQKSYQLYVDSLAEIAQLLERDP